MAFLMNGAQSANGVTEAKINLNITLKLQKLLENSCATVILTRSDDNAIYELESDSISRKKFLTFIIELKSAIVHLLIFLFLFI